MPDDRAAVGARMAAAASDLLASLDDDQLPVAAWPFPADGERRRWYDTPTDHGGLALGLRPEHLDAVRFTTAPRGLPAAALRRDQREVLQALLDVYLRRLPDGIADDEAAKVAGDRLDALHFLWAGGTEPGQGHDYRVQGPRLVVEYDNTQRGANHVHSVWRDPEGDFGDDVLARHDRQHHADPA